MKISFNKNNNILLRILLPIYFNRSAAREDREDMRHKRIFTGTCSVQ